MNRRTLAATLPVALFSLTAQSSLASDRMKIALATVQILTQRGSRDAPDPTPTPEITRTSRNSRETASSASRVEFSFDDFSGPQILYVGMLATWLDLGIAASEKISESMGNVAESPGSRSVLANAMQTIGSWPLLYNDISQFDGPEPFSIAHDHLVESYRNLDRAALYMSDGLTFIDVDSVERATEYIEIGRENIELVNASLPVWIPERSIIQD